MNFEANDTSIFFLNVIVVAIALFLWYLQKNDMKYCVLRYFIYGALLLPGLYLLDKGVR